MDINEMNREKPLMTGEAAAAKGDFKYNSQYDSKDIVMDSSPDEPKENVIDSSPDEFKENVIDSPLDDSKENMMDTLQETHFNGKLFKEPDKGYGVETSDFLVKKTMEKLTSAIIVPSAEDGSYVIELLQKRLRRIRDIYDCDLTIYENLSLLTLSVIYALADDETQRGICLLNVYQAFKEDYFACINELRETKEEIGLPKIAKQTLKVSEDVLNSAKFIISGNIRSGNLEERKIYGDEDAFFYVWETVESNRRKNIEVRRRKFTLAELLEKDLLEERQKPVKLQIKTVQPTLFDIGAEGAEKSSSTDVAANSAMGKKQSVMFTEIYEEMGLNERDE